MGFLHSLGEDSLTGRKDRASHQWLIGHQRTCRHNECGLGGMSLMPTMAFLRISAERFRKLPVKLADQQPGFLAAEWALQTYWARHGF
jgi:hypothetical protein